MTDEQKTGTLGTNETHAPGFDPAAAVPHGHSMQEIDREVRKLCDDAYAKAVHLITENRSKLEAIARALLEYETLDGSQVRDIVEHGKMTNPPRNDKPRSSSQPPALQQGTTIAPDYPPGLTEQPA